MRFILLVILLAFAILYATIGVRFGFLPDIPMSYWNAEGTNTYPISIRVNNASVNIALDATVNQGRTVVVEASPLRSRVASSEEPTIWSWFAA